MVPQILRRPQRVGLMDKSLALCLITSGPSLIRSSKSSKTFSPIICIYKSSSCLPLFCWHFSRLLVSVWISQGRKPGILGPVAIVSNSLLFLLPTESPQRSILCGLLIQVWTIGHSVSSLNVHADCRCLDDPTVMCSLSN